MKSKKLYITMSIFIVVMVGGGTMVSVYWEKIQIRCYIGKLDSEDKNEKKKAFEWLKTLAKKNIEDKRLMAFFKHPESGKQLNVEGKNHSLHLAAKNGDIVDLKILLDQGADINESGLLAGWTPLHWAASYGMDKIAQILIEYGADVNVRAHMGMTPLDCANTLPLHPEWDKVDTLLRKHGGKSGIDFIAKEFKKMLEMQEKNK